jgi:hypothetical protein
LAFPAILLSKVVHLSVLSLFSFLMKWSMLAEKAISVSTEYLSQFSFHCLFSSITTYDLGLLKNAAPRGLEFAAAVAADCCCH